MKKFLLCLLMCLSLLGAKGELSAPALYDPELDVLFELTDNGNAIIAGWPSNLTGKDGEYVLPHSVNDQSGKSYNVRGWRYMTDNSNVNTVIIDDSSFAPHLLEIGACEHLTIKFAYVELYAKAVVNTKIDSSVKLECDNNGSGLKTIDGMVVGYSSDACYAVVSLTSEALDENGYYHITPGNHAVTEGSSTEYYSIAKILRLQADVEGVKGLIIEEASFSVDSIYANTFDDLEIPVLINGVHGYIDRGLLENKKSFPIYIDKSSYQYLTLAENIADANLEHEGEGTKIDGMPYTLYGTMGRAKLEIDDSESEEIIIPETIDYNGWSIAISEVSKVYTPQAKKIVVENSVINYLPLYEGFDNLVVCDMSKIDVSSGESKILTTFPDDMSYLIVSSDNVEYAKNMLGDYSSIEVITEMPEPVEDGAVVELSGSDMNSLWKKIDLLYLRDRSYVFKLTDDAFAECKKGIELSGKWVFDGQGHSIQTSEMAGSPIFSIIEEGGVVKNLAVTGYISQYEAVESGEPNITSANWAILAGRNNGTIQRCVVMNSNIYMSTYRGLNAGMIASINERSGVIKECCVLNGNINVGEAGGNGDVNIGGLIGLNSEGQISDCYVKDVYVIFEGFAKIDGGAQGRLSQGLTIGNVDRGTSSNIFVLKGDYDESGIEINDKVEALIELDDAISKEENGLRAQMTNPSAWLLLGIEDEDDLGSLNEDLIYAAKISDKNMLDLGFMPVPVMNNVDAVYDKDKHIAQVAIEDSANIDDLALLMKLNPEIYDGAIVTLEKDIVYDQEEVGTIIAGENGTNADNLISWNIIGTESGFSGTFDGQGHTISNVILKYDDATGAAMFGTVGEEGKVVNLSIDNAAVVAAYDELDKFVSSEDNKIVLPIMSLNNEGEYSNIAFSGNLYITDDLAKKAAEENKTIEWSLVSGEMPEGASIDHAMIYVANIDDLEVSVDGDGTNKRNIIVMQNVGVGRNGGKTSKSCSNSKSNKSLNLSDKYMDDEVNKDYREYTNEEMCGGEPAYWLNYAGKGYTGKYTRTWAKGPRYPVKSSEDLLQPVVRIVYDVEGVEKISDALEDGMIMYANEDDEITIKFKEAPTSIKVGENGKACYTNSKTQLVKLDKEACVNGVVTVYIGYGETAIEEITADGRQLQISSNGHEVIINNGEGRDYVISDILGRRASQGRVDSAQKRVMLPSAGVYVVKVGDKSEKIVVR